MQWANISGHEDAYKFDRLITQMQVALLKKSSGFDDLKGDLVNQVSALPINLSQVRVKLPVIEQVKSAAFWDHVNVRNLEELRGELRGILQFRPKVGPNPQPSKVIDVAEEESLVERKRHKVKLAGLDMVAYRNRVHQVLLDIIDGNETFQKIKAGQPVQGSELEALCSLVLTQDPSLDLHYLIDYFPEAARRLDQAIRGVIGMNAQAVHERFTQFVQEHTNLASHQIKFLDLLQNHIARYGSIEVERLYEPPFTLLHSDGIDGVFPNEEEARSVIQIIESFKG